MTNGEIALAALAFGFLMGGIVAQILHTPDCVMLPNWLAEYWQQSCI